MDNAQKCAYLVSLSTTTMMTLSPSDLGKPVIKSIEISSQCWLEMDKECRRPMVLIVSTFFARKPNILAQNFEYQIEFHPQKNLSSPCGKFLKILNVLLKEKYAIPKEYFVLVGNSYKY